VTKAPRPRTGGDRAPFDVDRIVVLRIAIAAVAVVFLYLILSRSTARIRRRAQPLTPC